MLCLLHVILLTTNSLLDLEEPSPRNEEWSREHKNDERRQMVHIHGSNLLLLEMQQLVGTTVGIPSE